MTAAATADEYEKLALDYARKADATSAMNNSVTKQTLAQLSTTYATLALSSRIAEQERRGQTLVMG